jgi:hypothetical protein
VFGHDPKEDAVSDPHARKAAENVAEETTNEDLEAIAPERSELPPLQSLNVFATFDDGERARDAIVAIERTGIEGNNISALALGAADEVEPGEESTMVTTVDKDSELLSDIGSDVGRGAAIGAVAGALGSTAVALAIPGVGAALGAGILAITAGGAMAGTGVGGFAGAMSTTPASRGWEQALVDLAHGRVVVGVHTDDRDLFEQACSVLSDAGALSVRQVDADGEPV